MLGQCLMGDETFFADDTLVAKISGMVLHVLVELNRCGKGSFAVLTSVWLLLVMDELDMGFQLKCLSERLITEHANMRPNFRMHTGVMLL